MVSTDLYWCHIREYMFYCENWLIDILRRYGSVITTHLLKTADIASQIAAVILVDPISILLNQPDVAYNFVTSTFFNSGCAYANALCRRSDDQDSPTNGSYGISGPRTSALLTPLPGHSSGRRISYGRMIFSSIGAPYFLERRIPLSMPLRFISICRAEWKLAERRHLRLRAP